MLNFILCDDDERHNIYMKRRIEKILQEANLPGKVSYYSTKIKEVMEYSDTHRNDNNVYILDIDFNEENNGVDLAKQIRENEINAYIIYVSAHQEYSMLCYKTRTFDFLLKPIEESVIEECIKNIFNDFIKKNENNTRTITIKSGANVHVLNIDDIVFCEKYGNIAVFHTKSGIIRSYDSLESVQERLSKYSFYRCHKSFLVNLNLVDYVSIKESEVYMKNGEKCSISRNNKKGLIDYIKYIL